MRGCTSVCVCFFTAYVTTLALAMCTESMTAFGANYYLYMIHKIAYPIKACQYHKWVWLSVTQ